MYLYLTFFHSLLVRKNNFFNSICFPVEKPQNSQNEFVIQRLLQKFQFCNISLSLSFFVFITCSISLKSLFISKMLKNNSIENIIAIIHSFPRMLAVLFLSKATKKWFKFFFNAVKPYILFFECKRNSALKILRKYLPQLQPMVLQVPIQTWAWS